jgi:tetratricopeptide (TPR) repeat protein
MTRSLYAIAVSLVCAGCGASPSVEAPAEATAAVMTITTSSPEARTHFEKGEVLLDNLRNDEAAEQFNQALALDPNFVLARAYLGQATPGPEGLKLMEAAKGSASGLPEAERTLIDGIAAVRSGSNGAAVTAFRRVTEVAPGDWRGHYLLGQTLLFDQKYDAAADALTKSTGINADAGGAQNMLGYVELRRRDPGAAIAAFNEYVRILPQEPNPQDSLGEALLAAGKFQESEAAFQKALTLSPEFWNAHQGIAYARFYAGDWAGGREALAKAKATATRPSERVTLDDDLAAAAIAQRNTAEALRILDASEKTEGAGPADLAFVPVRRAQALIAGGRARQALAPLDAALKIADGGQLPQGFSRNLRRATLRTRITAEAVLGDAAAAEKTAAMLDQDASSRPDDPLAQSAMHYGRGQLATAQGKPADARAHFGQCSGEDETCRGQAVAAAEKAGDAAAAGAAREDALKVYARDPDHLIVRSGLAAPQMTSRAL